MKLQLLCIIFLSQFVYAVTAVTVKLNVIGNRGEPIEDAKVGMGFLLSRGGNSVEGYTNSNGYLEAAEKASFGVKIRVQKNGYYGSYFRTGYGDQNLTLILRKVKNPIAMYAKNVWIFPPVLNKKIGYDLKKGDYVAPYGRGITSDLMFEVYYNKKDAWNFVHRLSVRFKGKHDGLVPFYVEHTESEFKSDYMAPKNGYVNSWDFERVREKGKQDKTNFDKDRNYYFRVRTEVDKEGNIISAHYGKIYGEFPDITYHLNPTPNDRNVEFDPDKNLFQDLESKEKAIDP